MGASSTGLVARGLPQGETVTDALITSPIDERPDLARSAAEPAGPEGAALAGVRRIKLRPPALPRDAIARRDLEERVERAVALPLTLVVARAGFGKTTLLAAWRHSTAYPVAWLALDAGDGDLRRVALHVVAALRQAVPGAAPSVDALLDGARELDPETVAAVLADDLLDLPAPVVLVLDDLHAIEPPEPAALLGALLRHWPPQLRLVISSRHAPESLGADRLLARGFAPGPEPKRPVRPA